MEKQDPPKFKTPLPRPPKLGDGLARSNSRSKGINLNTVTPSPLKAFNVRSSSRTSAKPPLPRSRSGGIPRRNARKLASSHQNFQYDFVLPLAEQLRGLDVDEQLRLLALKEMNVVEIKDMIANLNDKLALTEHDLRLLREVIQRSLYKEMKVHRPIRTTPSTGKTPLKAHPHAQRSHAHTTSALGSELEPTDSKENQPPPDRLSKIWSNLSKPITFIQQIDTMLLNEFEKSLTSHQQPPQQAKRSPDNHDYDADPSPLKDKSNINSTQHTSSNYYLQMLQASGNSEDMFQAVSSSLWTFVNDMKSNMMASLNEQTELDSAKGHKLPQIDQGLLISDGDSVVSDVSDDDDTIDTVDLSMYSSMRRKKDKTTV